MGHGKWTKLLWFQVCPSNHMWNKIESLQSSSYFILGKIWALRPPSTLSLFLSLKLKYKSLKIEQDVEVSIPANESQIKTWIEQLPILYST